MFPNISSATTLLLAALSATSSAAATTPIPAPGQPFGLVSLRSASPVHFASVQASQGSLFLELPDQDASCDRSGSGKDGVQYATFRVTKKGELFLYSRGEEPQQVWVDRSGMGQGVMGYKTGAQPAPRNAELTGWKVDKDGNLQFANSGGILACPGSIDAAWSLWMSAGVKNPGGNKGCLGISARTSTFAKPKDAPSCVYTSS